MKRTCGHHIAVRRFTHATAAAVVLLAVLLAATALIPAPAKAATVSGAVKHGEGYRLLLVQANGTAKTVTITRTTGAFSIRGVRLGEASLQLVNADGSYYGPIVLKATATKAFIFIKGAPNLKIGSADLKGSYALVGKAPAGRYQTLAAYTAKATRGKPIGAGKLGRVTTSNPLGFNGPGADLDRDGIINAFDIDDNGNRIIDNIDRTRRGAERPRSGVSGVAAEGGIATRASEGNPGPPPPPPPPTDGEFRIFSNFKLRGATSINVNIPGIADIDGLISQNLPPTVTLATQIIGGERAQLDGLGNSYIREHTVGGMTYPRVNETPPTYTGDLLDLVTGMSNDAQIRPGALPSEIASGDCFVETAQDGTRYPGTLNFVFNTAPALKSYQFDTVGASTEVVYDASGAQPGGERYFTAPVGASSITLTFWRPQRRATPAEVGSGGGWVDIGGLMYVVQVTGGPSTPGASPSVGNAPRDAYSNASANGVPITLTPDNEGVLDAAADAPPSAANTVTFTLDLTKCYPSWATFGSGTEFDIDLMAMSAYGDNAARGLFFKLQ